MATEAEIIASNVLASAIEYKRLYDTTKKNEYKVKEQRLRRIAENIKLIVSSTSTGAVTSFNGRTGAVVLLASDVTGALGYTPLSAEADTLNSVTTRGNTTANAIDIGGALSDYYRLDTAATPTPVQGMMFWDSDRSTVDVQLDSDVSAKLGQDNFWYVKNQSGATIPKGKAVMSVGTLGSSGRILIDEMVADGSVSAKYLLGITAEDIANGADGFVINIGKLKQVNTLAFTAGSVLYCDATTPGNLTATAPSSPNLALPIAFVVHSAANGILAIRINTLDENSLGGGGGGSVAGANTQIQFNDGGVFGADADFTWNKTTNVLTVAGSAAFMDVSQTASFSVGYKIGSKWVTRYHSTLNNFIFGSDSATYPSITTAFNNFFAGNNSIGNSMTSANYNIAIGFDNTNNEPLRNLTTGNANVALGRGALRGTTSGFASIGIGEFALYSMTTTGDNIGIGYYAFRTYTRTGGIAIGTYAFENFAGNGSEDDYSIAIGYTAGRNVSNGNHVLIGYLAARDMSAATAAGATVVGYVAGYGLRTSIDDTALGHRAMGWFNSLQTTSGNVAVGAYAMQLAPWSRYMVAVGYQAGYQNGVATASGQNDGSVYVGYQAGYSNLGNYNVFLGYQAGFSETTASNTFILANGSAATTQILRGSFTDKWIRVQDTLRFTARTSNPSVSEAGHIYYNSTAGKHKWYDGSNTLVLSADLIKPVSIWSPTATDKVTLYKTDKAITIRKLFDVVVGSGSPSVTWQIKYATARDSATPTNLFSLARTTTSTSGANTTTFASPSIPAGSYIWLELSAVSGTVDEFNISFLVTED